MYEVYDLYVIGIIDLDPVGFLFYLLQLRNAHAVLWECADAYYLYAAMHMYAYDIDGIGYYYRYA